jgi:hypothetical protein
LKYLSILLLLATGCAIEPSPKAKKPWTPPPEHILVRGHQWTITKYDFENTKDPDMIGLLGLTDCGLRVIFYDPTVSNSELRTVLLHELLHAGTCLGDEPQNPYWNSNTNEHVGIYRLAEYESELFLTNPDLVDFLAGR